MKERGEGKVVKRKRDGRKVGERSESLRNLSGKDSVLENDWKCMHEDSSAFLDTAFYSLSHFRMNLSCPIKTATLEY